MLTALRYVTRILFVPGLAEQNLVRIPDALSFLYYLLRPLRLALRYPWRLVA